MAELLTTFDEGCAVNPYALAGRWADQTNGPVERTLAHEVDELVTMAALRVWLDRWLALQIHRVLRGGGTVEQASAASGLAPADVIARWRSWSAGQRDIQPDFPSLRLIEGHDQVERMLAEWEGGHRDA